MTSRKLNRLTTERKKIVQDIHRIVQPAPHGLTPEQAKKVVGGRAYRLLTPLQLAWRLRPLLVLIVL